MTGCISVWECVCAYKTLAVPCKFVKQNTCVYISHLNELKAMGIKLLNYFELLIKIV